MPREGCKLYFFRLGLALLCLPADAAVLALATSDSIVLALAEDACKHVLANVKGSQHFLSYSLDMMVFGDSCQLT
eukprot:6462073-Amphidinium_carterae.2